VHARHAALPTRRRPRADVSLMRRRPSGRLPPSRRLFILFTADGDGPGDENDVRA
jgi:hypothetical protein